jgi:hypothetical protein
MHIIKCQVINRKRRKKKKKGGEEKEDTTLEIKTVFIIILVF